MMSVHIREYKNMIYEVNSKLIVDHKCRNFCKIPYHGHKNGCPNFNNSPNCPPKVCLIESFIDLDKSIWFVTQEFDLKAHVEKMRAKHPDWSYVQLKNLLYWQNGVRKDLKEKTLDFINNHIDRDKLTYTLLPEAMGVMVIDTALLFNIHIQKNPIDRIIKISLIGYKKCVTHGPVHKGIEDAWNGV